MLRLNRVHKIYDQAGSFNEQVNLFGFIDDQVFLTKSGDTGVIVRVGGVDYECLDSTSVDTLTKRLESAFKSSTRDAGSISTSSKETALKSPTRGTKTRW